MNICKFGCVFECLCWVKSCIISRFWKFSRNCLAGLQSRQAAHTLLYNFGFLEKEPPGGQVSWFWVLMKRLAVVSEPPGDTSGFGSDQHFWRIWAVSDWWKSYS